MLRGVYRAQAEISDRGHTPEGRRNIPARQDDPGCIAVRIGAVARGETVTVQVPGQPDQQVPAEDVLAGEVKSFLDGLVPVVLSFGISQVPGMGRVPAQVVGFIERVRDLPLQKAGQAIDTMAGTAKQALGLTGPNAEKGLLIRPITIKLGGETHRLWAVNQGGKGVMIGASTRTELDRYESVLQRWHAVRASDWTAASLTAAREAYLDAKQAIADLAQASQAPNVRPDALLLAENRASAAERRFADALEAADREVRQAISGIVIPSSVAAPADVSAAQIAAQLPGVSSSSRAYGALVVGGRIYWLTTWEEDDNQTSPGFHHAVVEANSPLIGRFGFNPDTHNHIEQSAAAILRRLVLGGVNVSGAFVAVNKPRVCWQTSTSCDRTLEYSLPINVSLTVNPMKAQVGGGSVINTNQVKTYTGK